MPYNPNRYKSGYRRHYDYDRDNEPAGVTGRLVVGLIIIVLVALGYGIKWLVEHVF